MANKLTVEERQLLIELIQAGSYRFQDLERVNTLHKHIEAGGDLSKDDKGLLVTLIENGTYGWGVGQRVLELHRKLTGGVNGSKDDG